MRNILTAVIFLICSGTGGKAIGQALTLEHIALTVWNIDSSVQFYQSILNLDTIKTPFPGLPVKWLRIQPAVTLHLVQVGYQPVQDPSMTHLCFTTPNIDSFLQKLNRMSIPYFDANGHAGKVQVRGDGVTQLFIHDPNGYNLEINNAVQQRN